MGIKSSWVSAVKPSGEKFGSEFRVNIVHRHSMQSFQDFVNKIAEREGYRVASEIDSMMEAALKQSYIGRVIVWLVAKKYFRVASFVSRRAGFSLEMQPDVGWGDRIHRVKLRGRVVCTKRITTFDRISALS